MWYKIVGPFCPLLILTVTQHEERILMVAPNGVCHLYLDVATGHSLKHLNAVNRLEQ